MKIDDDYGVIIEDLYKDGWRVDEKVGHYFYFHYLRLSPTYELARKFNQEGLTAEEKNNLPNDFQNVLKAYKLLGNVKHCFFRDWWARVGYDIFGVPYEFPTVHIVSSLVDEDSIPEFKASELTEYIRTVWTKQGKTPTVIMAIPLDGGVNRRLEFVREFIGYYKNEKKLPKRITAPKLSLCGTRISQKSLMKGIKLTTYKGAFPQIKNWQLGAVTKFSKTYSDRLNWKNPRRTKDSVEDDDRVRLGNVISRAIKRYERIIENAARGKFPCDDPVDYQPFNYQMLYKRYADNSVWEEKELDRLKAKSSS